MTQEEKIELRAEFESWASANGYRLKRRGEVYVNIPATNAWLGWLASRIEIQQQTNANAER
jgi:hypothetical protein